MKLSTCCSYNMQARASFSMAKQARQRGKVVFIMGPTGTGKSRLAIDLAMRYPAEIINCDKIQVHRGLEIATNKVTEEERRGVPHHLLGTFDPSVDLSPEEFALSASGVITSLMMRDKLPIVVGGSNSYIKALAGIGSPAGDGEFRLQYDCCFLWVDVALPVLRSFVSERVDRMVDSGLIDEVRSIFEFNNQDYSRGIRRAIGVPEMDYYFRQEAFLNEDDRREALNDAVLSIKENTCLLAIKQLQRIHALRSIWRWNIHRIDATEAFVRAGADADVAWERLVLGPSAAIIDHFLWVPSLGKMSLRAVAARR